MNDILNRITEFLIKTMEDRRQLMIQKGFIKPNIEYTEELWQEFRKKWFAGEL